MDHHTLMSIGAGVLLLAVAARLVVAGIRSNKNRGSLR